METIKNKIEALQKNININKKGHLPLSFRIKLLQLLDKNIVNRVFFECLKKVHTIWEEEYPNHPIMKEIIGKANIFLYQHSTNAKEFEYYYNTHINFFESISGTAGLVGMTALHLCSAIAYGYEIEDYNGVDDDNAFDWQDWNPDFFASMAYSGGSPFLNEGNIAKRTEFWEWYLDMVNTIGNLR